MSGSFGMDSWNKALFTVLETGDNEEKEDVKTLIASMLELELEKTKTEGEKAKTERAKLTRAQAGTCFACIV
jgi:hypothetical protein